MRVATYLGDNTVPIFDSVVARVRARTGLDIAVDPAAGRGSADARRHGPGLDLLWICGHLGQLLIDEGRLAGTVVAAPIFDGESGPVYRTMLIGRAGWAHDLKDALAGRLAVNEPESWSGHLAVRRHVAGAAPGRWFDQELPTGAHIESIRAVAVGRADVAGIDSSVWAHTRRTEPDLTAGLEVIDATRDWPAPPILVGSSVSGADRAAMVEAIRDIGPADIDGLHGFVATDSTPYRAMVGP